MRKVLWKASDADIAAWAERHNIHRSQSELRCMVEDAQSLSRAEVDRVVNECPSCGPRRVLGCPMCTGYGSVNPDEDLLKP